MSLHIRERVPLAPYTTLACGGAAEYFVEVENVHELENALLFAREKRCDVTILGGGSNVLVSDDGVSGLVMRPLFTEVTYEENGSHVFVHAGAGVVLDELIRSTIEKNIWGLENLSGIPGSVGAVPMQNVGAYGVEAKDIVYEVHVYNRNTGKEEVIDNTACAFAYRHSLFKTETGKGYIILGVTFKLYLIPAPRLAYKDLAERFALVEKPELNLIRDTVLAIRAGKFPDWHRVGTAGSFFKNPMVSRDVYNQLKTHYPDIVGYGEGDAVKIPLGWILDHVLHLKGFREGNVGLYDKQALVLVRYENATSTEVMQFAEHIRSRVFEATGIQIFFEVVCLT